MQKILAIFALAVGVSACNAHAQVHTGGVVGGPGYARNSYHGHYSQQPGYRGPQYGHRAPTPSYDYGRRPHREVIQADPNDPSIGPYKKQERCTNPKTGRGSLCVWR